MKKILFIGDDLFGKISELWNDPAGSVHVRLNNEERKRATAEIAGYGAFTYHHELNEETGDTERKFVPIYKNAVVRRTYEEALAEIESCDYDHYFVDLNFPCRKEKSKQVLRSVIRTANLSLVEGVSFVDWQGTQTMMLTSDDFEKQMTQFGVLIVKKLKDMGLLNKGKVTVFTNDFYHANKALALMVGTGVIDLKEFKLLAKAKPGKMFEGKTVVMSDKNPNNWKNLVKKISSNKLG